MRILLVLAVVVVFAALLIFDTAALLRLTAMCLTGGCGIPAIWIALAGGVLVLAVLFSLRRSRSSGKTARVAKSPRSRPAARKTAARRKQKQSG